MSPGSDSGGEIKHGQLKNSLSARWTAPSSIQTLITQNDSEISGFVAEASIKQPLGFNLSTHVGEESSRVSARRTALENELSANIFWLEQVHGTRILNIDTLSEKLPCHENHIGFDASFTFSRNKVCTVMTADCLPILLCGQQGIFVAALHAGWQGLYQEIISNTVQQIIAYGKSQGIEIKIGDMQAYIGPAISQKNYQVDQVFYQRFVEKNPAYQAAFVKEGGQKFRADLKAIAHLQLQTQGVGEISDCHICTFDDSRFYSYRKTPGCGRFATMIWMS